MTQIGQPVPIERRLAADHQIVLLERLQRDEELLGLFRIEVAMQMLLAVVINKADVHGVGVQVDSTVEFVLSVVELHFMSFHERVSLSHETAEAATSNLLFRALSFRTMGSNGQAHSLKQDMMSINLLHRSRGPRGYCIGTSFAAAR